MRRKWYFASSTITDNDLALFKKHMHNSGDLTVTREVRDGIAANIADKIAAFARKTDKSYEDAAAFVLDRNPTHAWLWRCKVAPPGQANVFVLATEDYRW